MEQVERIGLIGNRLRSFASLHAALGESERAVFAIETAAAIAEECLRAGGILTDGGLVHRPDYCFPEEWTECLIGVMDLAKSIRIDGKAPTCAVARATALADALDHASIVVPIGEDDVFFLPMKGLGPCVDAAPKRENRQQNSEVWRRAKWFGDATSGKLKAEALKAMEERGDIKGDYRCSPGKRRGMWWYEVGSVCEARPDFRARLVTTANTENTPA